MNFIINTIFIICTTAIMFFNSCSDSAEELQKAQISSYCLDEHFKSKIELTNPQKQTVTESIPLTGTVESNPDMVVPFVSLVSGIISNTYFSLGEKVTKGQILAELKSSQLSELQSQYKTIEAQIKVAERKLQMMQKMFDDGVASQKDLMEAESELNILKAESEKINANLSLFSASTEKGVFLIKSPTTGIVTAKNIAPGQQITAEGDPLFTISDLSEVWVLVNVYATNIKNIQPGMEVSIKTITYPDEIFKGKISAISQVLDIDSKVMKARVVLKNADLKLKPGMLVDVIAIKELNTEALSIPTAAIIFDDNQHYVIIYKSNCEIEIRKVEILTKNNGTTFLSGGLSENDKIIAKNHLLIYEQIKKLTTN
jgi:cobalt-zinc-cadmium efflux system membrane fusion protein